MDINQINVSGWKETLEFFKVSDSIRRQGFFTGSNERAKLIFYDVELSGSPSMDDHTIFEGSTVNHFLHRISRTNCNILENNYHRLSVEVTNEKPMCGSYTRQIITLESRYLKSNYELTNIPQKGDHCAFKFIPSHNSKKLGAVGTMPELARMLENYPCVDTWIK